MNTCTLSGRLTADPEVKTIEHDGEPLAIGTFRLAVWRRGDATDYINVTAFGAGLVSRVDRLEKGAMVLVHGRLRHETWEDPSGQVRHALRVIADECYAVDRALFFGEDGAVAAAAESDVPAGVLVSSANEEGGLL